MRFDFNTYARLVELMLTTHPTNEAMELAVGGSFTEVGILELELLISLGLRKDGYLIDVGCGSGRLAKPLSEYLTGKYLGIDVVPELVTYARNLVCRSDWEFRVTRGQDIPEEDDMADLVCFFSVFTHLPHEFSYVYLREAKRVLKPQGKIVFSFLDLALPAHWSIFEETIKTIETDRPPNVFISKDAIQAWASHLALEIQAIEDGDSSCIPLRNHKALESKSAEERKAMFGQSFCVLRK